MASRLAAAPAAVVGRTIGFSVEWDGPGVVCSCLGCSGVLRVLRREESSNTDRGRRLFRGEDLSGRGEDTG